MDPRCGGDVRLTLGHHLGGQALQLFRRLGERGEQDQLGTSLRHLAQTSHAGLWRTVDSHRQQPRAQVRTVDSDSVRVGRQPQGAPPPSQAASPGRLGCTTPAPVHCGVTH
jgi:hypothetical protein